MPVKDIATNGIMPLWWNWQTRGTQNPVVAIPCRFDPDQRHHRKDEQVLSCSSFLWCRCQWGRRGKTRTYCYKITKNLPSFVNLPWQIFAEGSRRKRETAIPDQKLEHAGQILVRLFCGAAVNGGDAAKRKHIVIKTP